MKKIVLILTLAIVSFASCKKNRNADVPNATAPVSASVAILIQGKWRVAVFKMNGQDKSQDFAGYQFQFYNNGSVNASKPGNGINGNWSMAEDSTEKKLNLDFRSAIPFSELNNNWHVQQLSLDSVNLNKITPGDTLNLNFKR